MRPTGKVELSFNSFRLRKRNIPHFALLECMYKISLFRGQLWPPEYVSSWAFNAIDAQHHLLGGPFFSIAV